MNSEERELRVGWNTKNRSERGVVVVKHRLSGARLPGFIPGFATS